MTILTFLAVLVVLILVHELGHFLVAKWTGMRVDEFGIGFPPKVAGVKKGETEYTLNLLPIGGFVKILGEDGTVNPSGRDQTRAFGARPKLAQAAVLIAGVAMNVLLAWVLFVTVLAVGTETAVTETEASENARLVVTEVLEGAPADIAGIPRGAEITSLTAGRDSLTEFTPIAFSTFTEAHDGMPFSLTYKAKNKESVVVLTPSEGIIKDEPDRAAVGVALVLLDVVSRPLHAALLEGTVITITGLRDVTVGIGTLLIDALRLNADLSNVAGPIGIVGLVGEASAFGFTSLLMFTAFISLNLAIINLLPFPALDGGRLLFVAIEAVKGSAIDPRWASTLNTVGFALLIFLMLAVTYNDIVRIL